jgi:hypothetical protein
MYISPLGQDISPAEAQIQAIARYVAGHKQAGVSDERIRVDLYTKTNRPAGHPCAGVGGKNVCSPEIIEPGIISGAVLFAQQKEASTKGLSTTMIVLLLGGAIALSTQIMTDAKPRRRR